MDNSMISKEDLCICDASFKADKIQMSIQPSLFKGSDVFQSSILNTVELLTGLEDVNMDESSNMKVDRWTLKDKEGKNNDRLNKNEDPFRIREDTELSTYSIDYKEDLSICDASFKADKIQMSVQPSLVKGSDAFQSSGLNTVELWTGSEDVNMDESLVEE
ncbi:hypothetical protein QYM36_012341 [Artemia franciscana]|uniref:Uncharacterized protein n=1 Tax=Artemia franciscana TaxID=6661 RepID=A0AA88L2T9_ARTSF|nr:hypothetical protein QYM36_012341 [Artemia franciscana]